MSVRLKIAVVHYHFKPGGVTRVAQATLTGFRSVAPDIQFGFISGPPAYSEESSDALCLDGLGYTDPGQRIDPESLYFSLIGAARDLFGGLPDVWHIHNHSLGKNKAFAGVVQRLAADGRPILLHIHDFAEDGRPSNYAHIQEGLEAPEDLYPLGEHIHYGLLNGRDFAIMRSAGVPSENIHLLPNPIPSINQIDDSVIPDFSQICKRSKLLLYPVRALQRKNFGELALWSALAPEDTWLANTLGPSNPNYRPSFERWIAKAKSWDLPLVFELATQTEASFEQIIARANAMITTSVAEGFGLGFLEPWTFDKAVLGRDLPEITQDFKNNGIHLDHLYPRIDIPVDFLENFEELKAETRLRFSNLRQQYQQTFEDRDIDAILDSWIQDYQIDFGVLSEPIQEQIIDRIVRERPAWAQTLAHTFFEKEISEQHIQENKHRIQNDLNPEKYAHTLLGVYQTLANAKVERVLGHLNPEKILSHFLSPSRFNLLRSL
ncbi:MAG: hypothetical protein AAGB06_01475 [Verrucomicrobiota bacterium]